MIRIEPVRGKKRIIVWVALVLALAAAAAYLACQLAERSRFHYAEEFGFAEIDGTADGDGDGIPDRRELVAAAQAWAQGENASGDCAGMLRYVFAAAGYDLTELVRADAEQNPAAYADATEGLPALRVWLERSCADAPIISYTPSDWMAGDIVFFEADGTLCAAVCAYERNSAGFPYLICSDGSSVCADRPVLLSHLRFH